MKLHLPLCLLGALLTAMSASAMATSYLADGVDETDLVHSERFYDVGKGVYWSGTGERVYTEAKKLYESTGNFSFLGDLAPYISEKTFSTAAFSKLTQDGLTCGYQVPANQIQYWLSYYGVFYTGSEPLAYGYTYSRDYLERLGGTLSLDVGMLFYDNWQDTGNNLTNIGNWYFCGALTEQASALLKQGAVSGGYFADYFSESDIVYLSFNEADKGHTNYRPGGRDVFTQELERGFALEREEDGSLTRTAEGQLVYLSLVSDIKGYGHAITCYGFETDDNGDVTALKVVNSDDRQYQLFTLYLKEDKKGYMQLYTDAACQEAWKYSDESWHIEGIEYIRTPESLVEMYALYTSKDTELVWTGKADIWSETNVATTDALPSAATGWKVDIGGQSFHSYYDGSRAICFDDSAESTVVHIADEKVRSAMMPAEMHLHNASKEYLFVGESAALDSLMPQKFIIDGTGTAAFRNLSFATDSISYEAYTLRAEQGSLLTVNKMDIGAYGVLELAGGALSVRDSLNFGDRAILRVTETSTLSASVTLQAGSVFDCVLTPDLTDHALLSITGSLTLGGTVKLEIRGEGLTEGTRYAISTVTSGSIATENFFTEHGSLSFSDKTLWLTYHEVHSHTWNGGSCLWSLTEFGNSRHNTLHSDMVFTGGAGTITISGQVSPHHLVMEGGSYTFSGSGASIDCEGYVLLRGSSALTLNVPLTSQGFVLQDAASLTFKSEKDSVLRFLTAEEKTQLSFLGPVTYTVEDTGVMAGAMSIGAGTSMEFSLSHNVLPEGEVTALSPDSSLLLYNSSASRQNVTCEAGTSLSRFQGSIKVGREGDARGTTLSVSAPPTVGQYIIASGSTLLINESGTVQGSVSGSGTLVLGPGADFKLDVKGGHTSFADSLALDVRGAAEIGTEEQRLSDNWTRELSVSGQLSMHVAGDSTLHYDKVTLDGGTYTYYTTLGVGDATHRMDRLHVGENGGTITRLIEPDSSSYPKYAGITQIGSLTGNGRLNLEGEHFQQMSYFAIDGVGADGYTGEIHVTNKGAFSNDVYHLTVLELGTGLYDASVMLSNAVDNTHSRTALGLRGDVSLRGLESGPWGEAYLYSGSLRNTELDTSTPSPAGMIEEHAYTLSLVGNKDYHFSGEVLGPVNLLKSGKGTQSFRGDMSAFTGSATVSGGTLAFTHDVSLASALVEEKACLKGDAALNILGGLEMNSGVLTAQALTTTTASFSGQSVVKANRIQSSGAWTLNVGLDNLHIATAELASLSGAGSLTLGGLDIRYQTADVASATYKLLTLSRDFESQLRALSITCNGSKLSIGAVGSSPLYLQQTAEGGYDLLLDITDGTAPLPRGEYAELYWQAAAGVWSLGTGEQSGVWESEHVNDNFHDGDAVHFTSAAEVSVSGKVAPVAIFVSNESGTVSFAASKSDSAISGRGSLTKEGAGQLVISLANTYTGGTTVKEGTLTVGNASALGTGVVKLEGGTLDTGSYAVKNAVTATGGTLCASKYAGQLTVAGEVTLGSSLTYTVLNLNSGTLHGDVNCAKDAVFNANGGALDGALTLNGGTLNLAAETLHVTGAFTVASVTGLGLSAFSDYGTYTLISADSVNGNLQMLSYTKTVGRRGYAVSVSGGDLMLTVTHQADNLSWTAAKGTWTPTSVIGGKNYLDGDSVTFNTAAAVTVSGVIRPGDIIVDSAAKVTFTSDKKTPGSGFGGDGALVKDGIGLLTMNAGNTYTGDTELDAGTLKATAVDSFGTGVIIVKGGTLDLGGKAVANDIVLRGEATIKGDAKYVGNVTVEGDATLLAKTSYKGMTSIGAGSTLTLAPKATMAGSIILDGGTLNITAPKGMSLAKNMTMQLNSGSVSGLLTIGTGSTLVWQDGIFETSAPVLKGGTIDLGGENALTLTGSKAQVQFGDKALDLPGKGTVRTDEALTVNGGTVTVNSMGGYEGELAVNGGTLKLSTGKVTTENDIIVKGTAAVVNGGTHYGDITVDGLLAKGTTIKLLNSEQRVTLNASGVMLGAISGAGIVDVRGNVNITGAKLTNANILLGGTLTHAKGLTLAKGQTLTLDGGSVNGILTIGAGSVLDMNGHTLTAAPVLKGGTYDDGGSHTLTLTGAKADISLGEQQVSLLSKSFIKSDAELTVNSGTVTVNDFGTSEQELTVTGGTLKLATGKQTSRNTIVVNGTAAVVNGATHYGDIEVNGELAKGTTIKLLTADQRVVLKGGETLLGTISGAGIIDVNADINATAAKLTAATINLNACTFTNTKGIKLAKGQTLNLSGATLNLGAKGVLATVAGSMLGVSGSNSMTGSLTLGGGELVFSEGGTLTLDGTLTLSKPMTVTGSGSITYGTLKPIKGELSAFFGDAEVKEDGNTILITGSAPALRMAAAPLATAAEAPAPLDAAPAIPVVNPVADAMVQADWGILDAERAFMGAVNSRSQHATLLDKGRGAAWVSAFGASVRHGNQGTHRGSDANIEGAAFGLEHTVSDTGTLGLAVGRSKNRIAATGVTHLRQETAHVALYGQKHLAHGFTADAAATYGDTETKLGTASWTQKSTALSARLTHARMLSDATAFRTFSGLTYEATDAGSIGTVHTGSVQNLRAEVGAGATHTVGKAHLYAEAAFTGDMVRHNPTVDFGGARTHGANPGRLGLRATIGGIYAFTDTWSGTASYGIEAESRSTSHSFNIGLSKSF